MQPLVRDAVGIQKIGGYILRRCEPKDIVTMFDEFRSYIAEVMNLGRMPRDKKYVHIFVYVGIIKRLFTNFSAFGQLPSL